MIRMMPPDTIFLAPVRQALPGTRFVPATLPPAEIENCRFVPPPTDPRPRLAAIQAGWDWSLEPVPTF